MRIGDDNNTDKIRSPLRDRFSERDLFGADRQSITRILDITTSKDASVGAFDHGADLEIRIGRVSAVPDPSRQRKQLFAGSEIRGVGWTQRITW